MDLFSFEIFKLMLVVWCRFAGTGLELAFKLDGSAGCF